MPMKHINSVVTLQAILKRLCPMKVCRSYTIVIWQDGFDDYLVLMDNEFAPLVECGKPLIYLYPQPTSVSVQLVLT